MKQPRDFPLMSGDSHTQTDLLYDGPASRSSDPETSHLAEQEINPTGKRAKQQETVLNFVTILPGRTAREYAWEHDALELPEDYREVFHRRLPELEKAGKIKKGQARTCSIGKRKAVTWYPL